MKSSLMAPKTSICWHPAFLTVTNIGFLMLFGSQPAHSPSPFSCGHWLSLHRYTPTLPCANPALKSFTDPVPSWMRAYKKTNPLQSLGVSQRWLKNTAAFSHHWLRTIMLRSPLRRMKRLQRLLSLHKMWWYVFRHLEDVGPNLYALIEN